MARYVDGFVFSVPEQNLAAYRKMAAKAGKIWKEHGALEYVECVGDDLEQKEGMGTSFPAKIKPRTGEIVCFSFIVYKSKADRNRVNKLVMKDPRLNEMPSPMPFDVKRMLYGGFKTIVDL